MIAIFTDKKILRKAYKDYKNKAVHEQGKKDDRIFASAIAFTILNDTESMTRRTEKPYESTEVEFEVNYSFPIGYNTSYDQIAGELGLQ